MNETKTIFQKILDREIPGDIVYEDEKCFVLRDINPQAPTHLLIICKKLIPQLAQADDSDQELLGHLLLVARDRAKALGLQKGFRIVINSGKMAGETIPHLHIHLLSGRNFNWPPG